MKISLLVPTRKRPNGMKQVWLSALKTSFDQEKLEIIYYIDEDDIESIKAYDEIASEQTNFIVGERIILSQMWNECWKIATGEIFMHCADDIIFRSLNWDKYIREEFNLSSDKIIFVHGDDGLKGKKLGTHGFLHKTWTDIIGFFVPPYFSFWYNDRWLTEVADAINRRIYLPNVLTEHMHYCNKKSEFDITYKEAKKRGMRDNVNKIYKEKANERKEWANKLRKAIDSRRA